MNETLDRQTFINAMQQMFRRLDAQDELIARLLEGRETAGSGIGPTLDGERLYDTEDLCLMLHVSKRTIQRYRLLGALSSATVCSVCSPTSNCARKPTSRSRTSAVSSAVRYPAYQRMKSANISPELSNQINN
ncbi:MAG: hypothetical protein AUK64_2445 [bacterium P201]|nr:MAG: hypothetical protein AUK64_2445 [bacterium P201]